ncbi:hypothetical protein PENTCL1PPCAC_23392, partial [Pristionchus entomophagus]
SNYGNESMRMKSRHPHAHFTSLEIEYDNTNYHAADIIEGRVRIKTSQEILVRNVRVLFYGEMGYRDADGSLRFRRYFQQSCDLWRGVSECYLPPGSYCYRFSIGTPLTLPTTMKLAKGDFLAFPSTSKQPTPIISYLQYFCEVRLSEAINRTVNEHARRKEVHMEGVCLDWPDTKNVRIAREVAYVRNILDTSGMIGATMKLNKSHVLPGECIYCNVEVLNCFRKLEVDLSVIERFIVITKGLPFATKEEEELIYTKCLGTVKSNDTYRRWLGIDCWIPDSSIPYRGRDRDDIQSSSESLTRRISKGLFIQLRVKCGKLSSPLTLSIPLCVISDERHLPRTLPNGTRLSGAATV